MTLSRPPSRVPPATPKPIVNSGNHCFANVVLQALLHSPPFFQLMQEQVRFLLREDGCCPLLRSLVEFMDAAEEVHGAPSNAHLVSSEVIDNVLDSLLATTTTFAGYHQQDAEEFLTALLTQLSDELSALLQPEDTAATAIDEEWLEAGPRKRAIRTRQISPAHANSRNHPFLRLFSGTLRTTLSRGGGRVVVEPFMVLPMAVTASTRTLEDALLLLAREECVRTADDCGFVRRQVLLADLPHLLIIQLKRFVMPEGTDKQHRLHKVTHPFKAPISLTVPAQSMHKGSSAAGCSTHYSLCAIIDHHGDSLNAGHYTAQLHTATGFWRFDDERPVRPESAEQVEQCSQTSYLLFYERK